METKKPDRLRNIIALYNKYGFVVNTVSGQRLQVSRSDTRTVITNKSLAIRAGKVTAQAAGVKFVGAQFDKELTL